MTSQVMNANNTVKLSLLRDLLKFKDNVPESYINQYEKFLFLLKKYPGLKAVPTKQIDIVWHYHLQDQSLYKKDCDEIFGYQIIHKEAKTDKEISELEGNYNLTNQLWLLNFNSPLGSKSDMAVCGVDGDGGDSGNDDY